MAVRWGRARGRAVSWGSVVFFFDPAVRGAIKEAVHFEASVVQFTLGVLEFFERFVAGRAFFGACSFLGWVHTTMRLRRGFSDNGRGRRHLANFVITGAPDWCAVSSYRRRRRRLRFVTH